MQILFRFLLKSSTYGFTAIAIIAGIQPSARVVEHIVMRNERATLPADQYVKSCDVVPPGVQPTRIRPTRSTALRLKMTPSRKAKNGMKMHCEKMPRSGAFQRVSAAFACILSTVAAMPRTMRIIMTESNDQKAAFRSSGAACTPVRAANKTVRVKSFGNISTFIEVSFHLSQLSHGSLRIVLANLFASAMVLSHDYYFYYYYPSTSVFLRRPDTSRHFEPKI